MDVPHLTRRAKRICAEIKRHGVRQVRLHGERVLSFKYPAPRGYGVRGKLLGVYDQRASLDGILDDLCGMIGNT